MSVFVDIMGPTSQVGASSHLATAEDWERSSQYNGRKEPSGRSEQVGKRCVCIKIGEVSKLLHISQDTIRYYMELGLIVPGRHGNLYDFSGDSIEDIRWIHKLKEMGFLLKEIQKVLSLRRTSN